ncbi:unnamed protein product [Amoebophrya sp. A120]|nr:unnamed protein product [Amoebophrya sp. A120]|eukprot:GSA120T00011738001.1
MATNPPPGGGKGNMKGGTTDDDVSTNADSRPVRNPKPNLGREIANSIRDSAAMVAEGVEAGYGAVAGGDSKQTGGFDSDASRGGGAMTSDYHLPGHPRADMSDSSSDFGPPANADTQRPSMMQNCWRVMVFICVVIVLLAPCVCIGTGVFCLACRNEDEPEGKVGYDCNRGRPVMTVFGFVLVALGFVLITTYCFVCCCRRQHDSYLVEQDEDEYEEEKRVLGSSRP